jgi:hypothetical protein
MTIDGTWYNDDGEMRMKNGVFQLFMGSILVVKGTYTAADGKLTQTTTHIKDGDPADPAGKILSRDDMAAKIKAEHGSDLNPESLETMLNEMFTTVTSDYIIDGDTLSVTSDGETQTYTNS